MRRAGLPAVELELIGTVAEVEIGGAAAVEPVPAVLAGLSASFETGDAHDFVMLVE